MPRRIFIRPYHEHSLQEKPVNELGEIFSEVSDVLEAAAAMSDPLKGRSHVIQELEQLRERMKIPASNGRKSDGKRAGFMNCDVYTVHHMIMIFQFIFLFFSVVPFRYAANSTIAYSQVSHVSLGKRQFW